MNTRGVCYDVGRVLMDSASGSLDARLLPTCDTAWVAIHDTMAVSAVMATTPGTVSNPCHQRRGRSSGVSGTASTSLDSGCAAAEGPAVPGVTPGT